MSPPTLVATFGDSVQPPPISTMAKKRQRSISAMPPPSPQPRPGPVHAPQPSPSMDAKTLQKRSKKIQRTQRSTDASKSLDEIFPSPPYSEEPEHYDDDHLPRSHTKDVKSYSSANFATLPSLQADSSSREDDSRFVSRSDLLARGGSGAIQICPQDYAANNMLRHAEFTIEGMNVPRHDYLFTRLDSEDMQEVSRLPPLAQLNLKFTAMEAMTRFGKCFVYHGVNWPLHNQEETHAVLDVLSERVVQDKNAIWRSLAPDDRDDNLSEYARNMLEFKVRLLLHNHILVICGGTVVPCNEHGDPLVGNENKFVKRALRELFRLLRSDNIDWLPSDGADLKLDPYFWTRTITSTQTKAGKRDNVTLTIKRRSQMTITKSTDLTGFGISTKESRDILRREDEVSFACKRIINQMRKAKSKEAIDEKLGGVLETEHLNGAQRFPTAKSTSNEEIHNVAASNSMSQKCATSNLRLHNNSSGARVSVLHFSAEGTRRLAQILSLPPKPSLTDAPPRRPGRRA
ncbi:hypothetical protein BST61_g7235 [Cercospora zeina]